MLVVETVPDNFLLFFFAEDFSVSFNFELILFEVNLGPKTTISEELLIRFSLCLSSLFLLFLCDKITFSSFWLVKSELKCLLSKK